MNVFRHPMLAFILGVVGLVGACKGQGKPAEKEAEPAVERRERQALRPRNVAAAATADGAAGRE